jgi:two-component system, sensor histidine kinase and response regulator
MSTHTARDALAAAAPPEPGADRVHGVRLLVVDDDPLFRRSVVGSMSRAGFHVFSADDGAPAIALADATPPDVALVDLEMPTPGLEVVRHIKERHGAAVHVSVLSGSDDEDARLRAFDAGADDFLIKPVSMAELRRRMSACARTQQAYVEARLAREHAERMMIYGAEAGALLAHDLNNGLSIALSNVTVLSETLQVSDDDKVALDSTLRALQRMAGLVANFVDIGRFEDAAVKLRVERVEIRRLLDDVAAVHAMVMPAGARYQIACDPELVGTFDPALVERILHNLVGNAVRYCDKGGRIHLSAHRVAHDGDPEQIEIAVQNSGTPISTELLPNLFSKYGRGTNGKRGLGLYFCRLACEAHGGSIHGENRTGGPTFVVTLPGR